MGTAGHGDRHVAGEGHLVEPWSLAPAAQTWVAARDLLLRSGPSHVIPCHPVFNDPRLDPDAEGIHRIVRTVEQFGPEGTFKGHPWPGRLGVPGPVAGGGQLEMPKVALEGTEHLRWLLGPLPTCHPVSEHTYGVNLLTWTS